MCRSSVLVIAVVVDVVTVNTFKAFDPQLWFRLGAKREGHMKRILMNY